jgi:hypothetical protein
MRALLVESRGVMAAALMAALIAGPVLAQATDPELAAGMRQVSEGDFEGAVLTLDAAARRLAADGTRKDDLVQAYVHLGIAFVALDQRSAARERFRLALALEPPLTLSPERYSPKVIGVFEEARREAAAETARVAEAKAGPTKPAKGGGSSKAIWVALGVAGAAGGIVLATRGNDQGPPGTQARFTGAHFGTPVLGCPDGAANLPLPLSILVDAQGGSTATTVTTVSAVLIIVASPAFPGEVGFASNASATVSPQSVAANASVTLRVDTTLLCGNGAGDEARFNEWSGRLTLATSSGLVTLETADRLRVNIP